ncbi:DUF4386 domain-containing protein [Candidatus Kaiserbacteria bacterium]|nr:DUF4386 domain-containing protein [Candidatus Kaiserbacteria bacterium]
MNTIKQHARTAGLLYLLLVPLGLFGILYTPTLVVSGDVAATVGNILAHKNLFSASIASALAVQVAQIFLVLALYRLFKETSKVWSALLVALIIPAVSIAMLNEVNRAAVLVLLSGAEYLSAFTEAQIHALIQMFLELHTYGIYVAQIFWGLWLLPMGVLAYTSGFIPKFIGVLLIIACFGYLFDSLAPFLSHIEWTVSEWTSIGEFFILIWLLHLGFMKK